MYLPCLVLPYHRVPGLWYTPESVLTHTMPLLFAGADCSFMDFDGVRALVVLPELPVAGGADGGAPASVLLDGLEDCRELAVEFLVPLPESFVRTLVVLPEFAPAVGFVEFPEVELEALPESFAVLFDLLLLAERDLFSPAAGESPVGGVAVAEGSAAAAFLGFLVAVGVVLAVSLAVFPPLSLFVPCFLREEVAEELELLADASVPEASFESAFFLDLDFFAVVDVSPELACAELNESAESAAGFFFFFDFVVVESL